MGVASFSFGGCETHLPKQPGYYWSSLMAATGMIPTTWANPPFGVGITCRLSPHRVYRRTSLRYWLARKMKEWRLQSLRVAILLLLHQEG